MKSIHAQRSLLLLIFLVFAVDHASGFCLTTTTPKNPPRSTSMARKSSNSNDPEKEQRPDAKSLGFDKPVPTVRTEPQKVRVDMVDNVDSVSLTAIGFGLIAFNFFILANLGDGGIGGFVATIMNTFGN